MANNWNKTPELGIGLARSVMTIILWQTKKHRGLTSFIEKNGINGKWLKKEDHKDYYFSKVMKIVILIARYHDEDVFLKEWNALGRIIIHRVHNPKRTS